MKRFLVLFLCSVVTVLGQVSSVQVLPDGTVIGPAIVNFVTGTSELQVNGVPVSAGGSGTVTSVTATAPIIVTPSPIINTGVISITPGAFEVPLTFSQSLVRTVNTATLSGDSASPGNSRYYGTDIGGIKGWFALPTFSMPTITLTGDVTGSGTTSIATTIGANKVTLPMMATMATDSILGRATAATGNVEVLSALPFAFTGDVTRPVDSNVTTLAAGNAGNLNSGTLLAARMPAFTGDVTSSVGTVANTLVNIPAATTISGVAGTRGDVLYYGATGWAKLAAGTSGNQLTTNGAGADPTWAAPGSGGGGTPGGSNTQVQFNDSSVFGGDAGFTYNKTTSTATLAGPMLLPYGSATTPSFSFSGDPDTGFYGHTTQGVIGVTLNGTTYEWFGINNHRMAVSTQLGWTPSDAFSANNDTALSRNAAGVVEVNNGTPGTFKDLKADHLNAVTGFQVNGAAASGKILVGNGTNFVASTPTYPNAASPTALKWIRSDGTNWIASTSTLAEGAVTAGKMLQSDATNWVASTPTWPTAAGQTGYLIQSNGTNFVTYPTSLEGASTSTVSAGYAADTYLAGSTVTIAAGDWKVQGVYHCKFDMTKTAAGSATPIITVRMGTLGTTGDAAIATMTFLAGTAATDSGMFDVDVVFRSVGSGTSAVIQTVAQCAHLLAATGLTTQGASGTGFSSATSSGFNSTTQTKIGLSFNGGSSFSGTNSIVIATLHQP